MVKSVMQHSFSVVPAPTVQRSTFDRSCGYKTTFDAGYLVPVYSEEILPGDTMNFTFNAFARLATPISPFLDNLFLDWMAFFVPNRLVWNNWEKFNGQQDNPDDPTDFLVPINSNPAGGAGYAVGSLQDYFGIPTGVNNIIHTVLPIRAYNLIYNTWIKDQNLIDNVVVDKDDGPDDPADYVLLRRGKRHDYFTSCLPWPQKGDEVSIPLGTTAPITGLGVSTAELPNSGAVNVIEPDGTVIVGGYPNRYEFAGDVWRIHAESASAGARPLIFADLTDAADVTINALRTSVAMQQFLEIDARGGTRYTEVIRAHFGVISPDARLQRPEYLGGGSHRINVTPVAQTSPKPAAGTTTVQGNLAGFGTVSFGREGFTKSFTEHGYVLVLVSARADLSYQQGLERKWSRRSREEFFWPSFAHLGEQAVLNKEIYFQGVAGTGPTEDEGVFGYQERYAEYRYGRSMITGLFRSQAANSLDYWHLAQEFTVLPELDEVFINDDPPVDRVIAVTSEPHFLFDALFRVKHARPMPVFSVPGLMRL